ncbi:MAG: hypothetical protein AB7S38_27530 [Vulcanimicrobiota bacterium]
MSAVCPQCRSADFLGSACPNCFYTDESDAGPVEAAMLARCRDRPPNPQLRSNLGLDLRQVVPVLPEPGPSWLSWFSAAGLGAALVCLLVAFMLVPTLIGRRQLSQANDLFQEAQAHHRAKADEKALAEVDQARQIYARLKAPLELQQAMALQADVLRDLGRDAEALEYYSQVHGALAEAMACEERLQKQARSQAMATLKLGQAALATDPAEAATCARRSLELFEANGGVGWQLGKAYHLLADAEKAQGDRGAATQHYYRAYKLNPDDSSALAAYQQLDHAYSYSAPRPKPNPAVVSREPRTPARLSGGPAYPTHRPRYEDDEEEEFRERPRRRSRRSEPSAPSYTPPPRPAPTYSQPVPRNDYTPPQRSRKWSQAPEFQKPDSERFRRDYY